MSNSDHLAPSSHSTSSGLIRRAKLHDAQAWERLVDLYGPLVFHWSVRSGLTSADAADMVQEVFLAAWRGLARFEHQGGTFRGWLRVITSNKLRDYWKKHTGEARAEGGTAAVERFADIPNPTSVSSQRQPYLQALQSVRNQFEESTWQAFWRTVVDGQATADVAADLGISPTAVRQNKSRVLRRLRDELGDA